MEMVLPPKDEVAPAYVTSFGPLSKGLMSAGPVSCACRRTIGPREPVRGFAFPPPVDKHCRVRPGKAWRGKARRGEARQGKDGKGGLRFALFLVCGCLTRVDGNQVSSQVTLPFKELSTRRMTSSQSETECD